MKVTLNKNQKKPVTFPHTGTLSLDLTKTSVIGPSLTSWISLMKTATIAKQNGDHVVTTDGIFLRIVICKL